MAFTVKMQGDHAEIYLYDVIGESWFGGVTAHDFAKEMKAVANAKTIDVRINSAGGDVFDGLAIHQLISEHRDRVTIKIDSLAASIASVIAMAGAKRVMNKYGFLMIHNPYTVAVGDAAEMRKMAETLDSVREQIVGVYRDTTDIDPAELMAMMDAETWIDSTTALDAGWVTEISDAPAIAACANPLQPYKHAPKQLAAAAKIPQGKPPISLDAYKQKMDWYCRIAGA